MNRKTNLLVVDGSRTTMRYIDSIFGGYCQIHLARTGIEAMDVVEIKPIDIIIMNRNLPDMDGFDLLEKWHKERLTDDISVVIAGDERNKQQEVEALQKGAADYISMPFVPEILKLRVDHLVELHYYRKELESEIKKQKKKVSDLSFQAMITIAHTIDLKDRYGEGHSLRVALYSREIARRLGWTVEELENLYNVALLHDIGKIAIEDSILNKMGTLTEQEYESVKRHTKVGADIVKNTTFIPGIKEGISYHHERYDGTGYVGLKGKDIPLIARILAVADAVTAMEEDRPFRRRLSSMELEKELISNKGKQFDPDIVNVAVEMLHEGYDVDEKLAQMMKQIPGDVSETGELMRQVVTTSTQETKSELEKDSLTGFLNRRSFEEKIEKFLRKPMSYGTFFMMDMDNFKSVNDTYGHLAGDELILIFADIIKNCVREQDFVCRVGGDEIAIFFPYLDKEKVIRKRADEIMSCFAKERERLGYSNCSVSIGIMTKYAKSNNMDYDKLYKCADNALYYVKNNGKDDFHIYASAIMDGGMDSLEQEQLDVQQLIQRVAERKEYMGAYRVEYDSFSYIYRFIARNVERTKQPVQIALFTFPLKEKSEEEVMKIQNSLALLEKAIAQSLRRGDVTSRISLTQQIVILMGANKENGMHVVDRMVQCYDGLAGEEGLKIEYDIKDVSGTKKDKKNS
ncbi:diguanylate cyclase (GGDEF) domain protein [Clostridium sp. CAG:167]|nr:diguanylate cyclase (GGDEF) domain protein [Clostridium sp. CAG:167]